MRWARFALILSISLFTFGLQAAPGPYVLCVSKCEIAGSSETIEMLCWSGPAESGCCVIINNDAVTCADPFELAGMGCCVADVSCPPIESCRQFPCEDEQTCPSGQPECFYCLPSRVVADRAPHAENGNEDFGRSVHPVATTQLLIVDNLLEASHTHSPPGPLLAHSGSDTCIEICLLLI